MFAASKITLTGSAGVRELRDKECIIEIMGEGSDNIEFLLKSSIPV